MGLFSRDPETLLERAVARMGRERHPDYTLSFEEREGVSIRFDVYTSRRTGARLFRAGFEQRGRVVPFYYEFKTQRPTVMTYLAAPGGGLEEAYDALELRRIGHSLRTTSAGSHGP